MNVETIPLYICVYVYAWYSFFNVSQFLVVHVGCEGENNAHGIQFSNHRVSHSKRGRESLNQIKPTPCQRRILAKKPHHSQVISYTRILQQSLCNNNQSSVLLEFKQSFLIGQHAFDDPSAYPKLQLGNLKDMVVTAAHGINCLYGSINFSSVFFRGALCIFKGLISLMIISITLRSLLELSSF
ncbi:unnamed protein product, partial [Vitis vinifera]|uniref:Uncharacterized protein n=1 Tax=Vitis vinifera TaxID=29760 RepID=D7TXD8_VITVI